MPMKLPAAYKSVTLSAETYDVPYPPLGFYAIAEHGLGNGDTFGLYWPIGREDNEPIVAETYHDEWSIQPHFSSLERFLAVSARVDDVDDSMGDDRVLERPSLQEDPQSPVACLLTAREHLKSQKIDAAIECLEAAVSILPEYRDAQALLCSQYRRVGKNDTAIKSAIQAIISPPCFGVSPVQSLQWLSRQSTCPAEISSDPIWLQRERLTLKFGGVKENYQYQILFGAIGQYLDRSAFLPAMTLMQAYAELMYRETVSFQERNNFNAKEFVAWQRNVAAAQYGKSRTLELPDETA